MPTPKSVTLRLSAEGDRTLQNISLEGSPHRVAVDTYRAFGGEDSAPSPLAYALCSLTSCMQITAGIVARDLEISLGHFEFALEAEFPPAVLATGAPGNANFSAVKVDATVETDAEADAFERFTREVERRCPITQLFARSGVALRSHWEARELRTAPAP